MILNTWERYLRAFNERSEQALSYNEDGNCITLSFDEGKIDFISSTQITDFPAKIQTIFGHRIAVDDPVEIVCKKNLFSGGVVRTLEIYSIFPYYMKVIGERIL